MRITIENTAGLIIDIQERLFPSIYENEQLTHNTIILINGLKTLEVPIVVTQQYTKGLGTTIPAIHETLGEYQYIEKTAFSCCDEPNFMIDLDKLGKKFVVISGIESHVCVLQTTIDLLKNDYIPVVVEDCVSSRRLSDKQVAIERMRKEGAVITTYESILFELLRYSGSDALKAITKLVK
jgi:nicotinamidase-related amidase